MTETMNSFILMMMCNPSIQAKAQEALDKKVCGERLPDITDRENGDLVFVEAVLMEVYRWVKWP